MDKDPTLVDALETVYVRFIAGSSTRGQAYTRCRLAEATVANWRSEFFAANPKPAEGAAAAVGA